jgi:hypothetical protein
VKVGNGRVRLDNHTQCPCWHLPRWTQSIDPRVVHCIAVPKYFGQLLQYRDRQRSLPVDEGLKRVR